MIRANELRVGNWVKTLHTEPHRPIMVQAFDIGDVFSGRIKCEPIPLTEEWLEKFDWEKEGIYYDSFEKSFYVFSGLGDPSSYGKKVKLEYVHQLQNLYYALTGEELTLNEETNN